MLLSKPGIVHIQMNDIDGIGNNTIMYPESTSDDIIVNEDNDRLTQFLTTVTTNENETGDPVCIMGDVFEISEDIMTALEKL